MCVTEFMFHLQVIEECREILNKAEAIKKSPEFRKAMGYMRTQKQRGRIKEVPCKANGYIVEGV